MPKIITASIGLVFLLVVSLLTCTGQLWSQTVAGAQLSGLITDPSGAAVPNVKVTATQTDRGLVRTTASGADGSYLLPSLPVGPYKLEAQVAGFATYVQTGIRLEVGNTLSINISLSVGTAVQHVEVTANVNMMETQATSVSQVVDQERIVDLPLNGRQATQLIFLSGAATIDTGWYAIGNKNYPSAISVNVAGGQTGSTNYLLDGGEHMDNWSNVNLPMPFPDALQEFSVQTNSLSARYGVHPGAVVNAVTKSGTNRFHGNAFEFLRNGALNARNFFSAETDTLKRNQFGGTIGGPIIKDKVFFFFGGQGTTIRTAPGSNIAHVPTQAVLNGDWSQLESASCRSGGARTITNPATGQVFANSQVSPSLYNQQALNILKDVPLSSDPCGEIRYAIPAPQREEQFIGRVDWNQSAKSTIFGRYFFTDYSRPPDWNHNLLLLASTGLLDRVQAVELGNTYSISPTTVNSARLGWTRLSITRGPAADSPNPCTYGIMVYCATANQFDVSASGYFGLGGTTNRLTLNHNNTHVSDNVDLMRGRHNISLGGEWIHYQTNLFGTYWADGRFGFNGQYSNDALLDFMLGLPSAFSQAGAQHMNVRQDMLGVYASDNVRLTKHFSLLLGLRWEPFLPEREIFNRVSWFDRTAFNAGKQSTVFTNAPPGLFFPGDPGYPTGGAFANRELALFQPRAGLVWDPTGNGRQTIRVGYGLFNDQPYPGYLDNTNFGSPWGSVVSFTPSQAGGLTNPYLGYPGGSPFPIPQPPPSNITFPAHGYYYVPSVNFNEIQMQQWDVSYERQLTSNWLVSATYLGNKTSHVWLEEDQNFSVYIPGMCNGTPCSTPDNADQRRVLYLQNPVAGSLYSSIIAPNTGANAIYNGLLLSAQHRFSHHYTVQGNYTWSHCISNGDFLGELGEKNYQNPYNLKGERGNCDFDIRHNLNISFIGESPHFANPWMNRLLGGWQFAPIVTRTSGAWFSPYTGLDNSLTALYADRPNVIGNPYMTFNRSTRQWLNPQAFVPNALGTFGNAGRNSVRAPSYFNVDTALSRYFNIRENHRLEVRFEAFNLFNHTNFSGLDTYITDSTFGVVTAALDPRILQFALKYSF